MVKGQPPAPPDNILPRIASPSPDVAAFAREGKYEVNLFNGTPDISIPLYNISIGELSVPISISYNASGIRVSEIPSNIGCGWSLNAGGAITRKVMGLPDEYQATYQSGNGIYGYLNGNTVKPLNQVDKNTQSGLDYIRDIANNKKIDAEPDIYSYNIPGKGGKFIFSQQDNLTPLLIPYEPIKVTPVTGGAVNVMFFNLTDESGVNFDFKNYEMLNDYGKLTPVPYISSWLMTKMTSSNGQDSIKFNYSDGPSLTQTITNDNFTIIDQVWNNPQLMSPVYQPTPIWPTAGQPPLVIFPAYTTTFQKNLDNINFRNGKIEFQLAFEARHYFALQNLKPRLQKIKIYSLQGITYSLIREIEFYHSYFIRNAGYSPAPANYDSSQTRRIRLDSLIIRDGTGANVQAYSFGYNSKTDNYGLPDQNGKGIDYWGYYNGKFATTLVPRTDINYSPYTSSQSQTVSVGPYSSGTREPDPAYMQSGMLNKITYPTGGYTLFEYETNQYSFSNLPANAKFAGGLRIKKISSYDGVSALPIAKTYTYGQNESGYGVKNFVLENYFFQITQSRRYWDWSIQNGVAPTLGATEIVRTFLANPIIDVEPYDAAPVAYPFVTEYTGDGNNNTGKTIYQFSNVPDGGAISQYMGGSPFILSNHYHRGQILFKSVYRRNTDKSYTMVAQTENHYAAFADNVRNYSALSVAHTMFSDGYNPNVPGSLINNMPPANASGGSGYNASDEYNVFNYNIQSGDKRLTQTIQRVYDQADPSKILATATNYYYDNFNHMQPTRIVTGNSKGETITDSLKYSHEFAQAGNVYQTMVSKNIINKVIQDKKTNNTSSISLQMTNYYDAGNNNLLPQSIQEQVGFNPIETRSNFLNYDKYGNVLGMQKINDILHSYIWDYKNVSPIAMVVNASSDQISSTSFEADGNGNWTFTGTPVADTTAPTGSNSYPLSASFPISKSGLQSAVTYTVSYWSKSGSYSVTGSTITRQGRTTNGWTYFEHTVTAATAVTISGTGSIDELRLYPSTAQMTTYTYAPLLGATTICDANNRITYYLYDTIGRLKWIKNQDGNIIKTMQYHYKGIPGLQY